MGPQQFHDESKLGTQQVWDQLSKLTLFTLTRNKNTDFRNNNTDLVRHFGCGITRNQMKPPVWRLYFIKQ